MIFFHFLKNFKNTNIHDLKLIFITFTNLGGLLHNNLFCFVYFTLSSQKSCPQPQSSYLPMQSRHKIEEFIPSDTFFMSSIKELNSFTQSLTDLVCLSLFNDSLSTQVVLVGRKWSFNSFFRVSQVEIWGFPNSASSSTLVHHHNFILLVKYILVMETLLPSGI